MHKPGDPAGRAACLLVPNLPLAAELRAHPELSDAALVVATAPGPHAEIIAVSAEAARRGVRVQSSVAHARAVCAELIVHIASPALEAAARAALLDAALSVSPRAAAARPGSGSFHTEGAVHLDASGVGALFHSEAGFATALITRAQRLGLPGNAAVASSRRIAHIAARALSGSGEIRVLPPGTEASFLAPLPIDILDPEGALKDRLARFGVHTVSGLLALPQRITGDNVDRAGDRALVTRLGPKILRLIELARGQETDLPLPVPDTTRLLEAIDLEYAIDRLEPLNFVIQGMLSRLLARLEVRHLACRDLLLTLQLENGGCDSRHVTAASPTLDRRNLLRLVSHALESHPPQAAAVSLTLETEGCLAHDEQLDLFRPAGPAPAALAGTLAELEALCGSQRIGSPRVADHHHPGAFRMAPFQPSTSNANSQPPPPPAGILAIRALRPPVHASVTLSQGAPTAIRSAVANGRVIQIAGPWRTTGGWWSKEEHFAFDSFDVQTHDGTVTRLRFDHLHHTWHIDAIYD
jgi:protein ImuB